MSKQLDTSNLFFEHPILNSPYSRPARHWELDRDGQPTQRILETRRRAEFITPIPKPKKRYRYGSETRKYLPDFVVLVDDGHGPDDPLHLLVEIKGYRREDAKEKKLATETYWVPGVNHLGAYGRWAFAEDGIRL